MPARLEVIAGPMFSGKTGELIRRIERARLARKRVQLIKPRLDDRTKEFVAARSFDESGKCGFAKRIPAVVVGMHQEFVAAMDGDWDVIGLDEAQFFLEPWFLTELIGLLEIQKDSNLRIIASGLDLDYRLEPFGPMPQLLAMADEVNKLTAVCVSCGADARFTQRLRGSTEQIQVGDAGDYEVRCRTCHYIPSELR